MERTTNKAVRVAMIEDSISNTDRQIAKRTTTFLVCTNLVPHWFKLTVG
ncbi:hypothetical protein BF7_00120 [Pseudomonas phage Bf7]|uniref:Uncharacterized protein n=1 Tax=Pseudomonas phage Bf7 TaxID=1100790 RepID=H2ELW0_9CAUD|nr:hypothetical protein BF7_00120 [Pseudomonas phage Bf7]AEX65862.1 hypothetical protein BF7_00120 [Pseudomonas phage Bf7]